MGTRRTCGTSTVVYVSGIGWTSIKLVGAGRTHVQSGECQGTDGTSGVVSAKGQMGHQEW